MTTRLAIRVSDAEALALRELHAATYHEHRQSLNQWYRAILVAVLKEKVTK